MEEKKLSFEQAIGRLQQIVSQMERGEAPLDESLALFTEGTTLLRQCKTLLDKAEQQVTLLTTGADGQNEEAPFTLPTDAE